MPIESRTRTGFTVFDRLGREIHPGDVISYGHLDGRRAGLRIGKVIDIYKDAKHREVRLKVWGLEEKGEPRRSERPGLLQYPDRMVVIPPELVPDKYRNLLDSIQVEHHEPPIPSLLPKGIRAIAFGA